MKCIDEDPITNLKDDHTRPITPSLGEMIDEVITEMDPEQGVEEQYLKRNEIIYCW